MKVLVAPLDWGLGHATRCIPVIKEFLRQGAEVELAVVKSNARLLRDVFPDLRQRLAPSYNVVYPKRGYNMGLWLIKNGIHLNSVARFEHRYAEEMVNRYHYDVIFSDNRFGFYSKKAKSIYMTHQRRIAFPAAVSYFEPLGQTWHATLMKQFEEIWVPDYEMVPGLAGSMSHVRRSPRPVKFVGPLSRFSEMEFDAQPAATPKYKFVAVVSGVEPARSRFEQKLKQAFLSIPGNHVIIQGRPSVGMKSWTEGNIQFYSHLPSEKFAEVVRDGEWLVSRGGYSTIMDMAYLGSKCIFVPTPGQYEQGILAENLSYAGYANCLRERALNARNLLTLIEKRPKVHIPQPPREPLLADAVKSVLSSL